MLCLVIFSCESVPLDDLDIEEEFDPDCLTEPEEDADEVDLLEGR